MMRSRTFVVPAGAPPDRVPDPLPAFTFDTALERAPPNVADRLSDPSGDDLLAPVVLLAPRGRAWQTDEVQAQLGTTVQHKLWAAFADGLAGLYRTLWRALAGAYPTLATEPSLQDWERDYGLPDPCLGDAASLDERRRSVRSALIKPEDASRKALIGLARALGYHIAVTEWEGFELGMSGFGEDGEGFGHPDLPFTFFIVGDSLPLTWIEFNGNGFGEEGFGSFPPNGLVCLVNGFKQAHTQYFFDPGPPDPPPAGFAYAIDHEGAYVLYPDRSYVLLPAA